jgi:hypothetical protein
MSYNGVTGPMQFDPNDKQIRSMYLGTVHDGHIEYRKTSMQKEYARVGEDGVQYAGPSSADAADDTARVAVFGPGADKLVKLFLTTGSAAGKIDLVGIASDVPWGKASRELVNAVYDQNVVAIIALDRSSSHLAEQIGAKSLVPVLALSSDHTLTSINIPWIFRMPEGTTLEQTVQTLSAAEHVAGPSRSRIRDELASGRQMAGIQFTSTGEPR